MRLRWMGDAADSMASRPPVEARRDAARAVSCLRRYLLPFCLLPHLVVSASGINSECLTARRRPPEPLRDVAGRPPRGHDC